MSNSFYDSTDYRILFYCYFIFLSCIAFKLYCEFEHDVTYIYFPILSMITIKQAIVFASITLIIMFLIAALIAIIFTNITSTIIMN